jgi:hypothetical protein
MDHEAVELIQDQILSIRGQQVILDSELASLYGVETGALNRAVSRNQHRFPEDFCFQLSQSEWADFKCQVGISSELDPDLESQNVTSSGHGGRRGLPRVFTEHGALMASTILRSKQAVAMSVFIIRAFVQMREALASNQEILKRLTEIDHTLLTHDSALRDLYNKILPLLEAPAAQPKRKMGFHSDSEK